MLLVGIENKLILRQRNKVLTIPPWKNAILSLASLSFNPVEVTLANSTYQI